jgi:hypothetical protein
MHSSVNAAKPSAAVCRMLFAIRNTTSAIEAAIHGKEFRGLTFHESRPT